MPRDRQPVDLYTPVSYAPWERVEAAPRARPRPASRDVELSNALDDGRSVARVQRALDNVRTTPTRAPARPARRQDTTVNFHNNADAAARQPVRPPSDEQLRGARRFLDGGLGGGVPQVVDEQPDEFDRKHPFGTGFDRHGRQLQNADSPAHTREMLARYEHSRVTGYRDDAAQQARARVAATFDSDGNLIPEDRPAMPPTATPGNPRNTREVQKARRNIADHLAGEVAPYLRGYRQG